METYVGYSIWNKKIPDFLRIYVFLDWIFVHLRFCLVPLVLYDPFVILMFFFSLVYYAKIFAMRICFSTSLLLYLSVCFFLCLSVSVSQYLFKRIKLIECIHNELLLPLKMKTIIESNCLWEVEMLLTCLLSSISGSVWSFITHRQGRYCQLFFCLPQ